jgi:hypothetical protein
LLGGLRQERKVWLGPADDAEDVIAVAVGYKVCPKRTAFVQISGIKTNIHAH